MKASFIALVASALLGSAAAGSFHERRHGHALLHHVKKDYPLETSAAPENETCGCTTIWSTWYGEATLMQPPAPETTSTPSASSSSTPSTTPAATTSVVETTSSIVETTTSVVETTTSAVEMTSSSTAAPSPSTTSSSKSVYVAPKPSSEAPKPSTSEAPAPSSYAIAKPSTAPAFHQSPKPKPSKPSGGYTGGSIGGGKRWAMTYSPYTGESSSSTSCKSQGEVASDITGIAKKGFSTIRIYSTDCDHLPNVVGACKTNGLKVILGVFIKEGGISDDTYSQLKDIVDYFEGDYSMVSAILIGNEALFNGYVSAGELANFIGHCKDTLKASGYSGPVGTAETVADLQNNKGALKGVLDIVGANVHPFFATNGAVKPEDSGSYVKQQMDMVSEAYGVPVINSETGWPTQGPDNGGAVPSPENQKAAIDSMSNGEYAGKTVFFSSSNDGWKNDGSSSVEPYFGCADQFD